MTRLEYALLSLAAFVIANLASEYVSRKVWPRPVGQ